MLKLFNIICLLLILGIVVLALTGCTLCPCNSPINKQGELVLDKTDNDITQP